MPNTITNHEDAAELYGIPARAFAVVRAADGRILSQRIATSRQINKHERLVVSLRFDDQCNNGHESFAITADLYDSRVRREGGHVAGGCLHDEIAQHFPELAHLIPWHLTSTDGPMHYLANAVYLAGDRDCYGLRKGEQRQIRNGKTGALAWKRDSIPAAYHDGDAPPTGAAVAEWKPWMREGKGKERQLDAARRAAVWLDATDAELMQEPDELRAALAARLPALLERFRAAMLACGFVYPEPRN